MDGESSLSAHSDSNRFKISSIHHINEACHIIASKISEVIDNTEISSEKKEQCKNRFTQTYIKILEENLGFKSVLNQSHSHNLSSSPSSTNCERRKYLNEMLLPKIGKLMTEVASKRKCYPQICHRITNQRLKLERHNLKQHEVKVENHFPEKMHEFVPKLNNIEDCIEKCSKDVKNFNMSIQTSIKELQEMATCQQMLEKMAEDKANKILFAPSPLPLELNLSENFSSDIHPETKMRNECMHIVPSLINTKDCQSIFNNNFQ